MIRLVFEPHGTGSLRQAAARERKALLLNRGAFLLNPAAMKTVLLKTPLRK
jgi:hypothetical protein